MIVRDAIAIIFACVGAFFTLLAVVGIMKHPDLFTRMQSTTKASTFGIGCMMIASAVHFWDMAVAIKCLLVVIFFFITQPIAAHMLARAAYISEVELADSTVLDELKGHYDPDSHELLPEKIFASTSAPEAAPIDAAEETTAEREGW